MYLVDSHCHFDLLDLAAANDSVEAVITRANQAGVKHFLNVCVSINKFPNVLAVAEHYPSVSASVGLHPNEQAEEIDLATLIKLGQNKKVVAIGETGLDYYRSQGDLTWQQERFRMHIAAAKKLQKQLIIHSRAAKEDTIAIMQSENAGEVGGVMHCFSEDWEMAKQALDMNFYISFSGTVTFKNATNLQEVAKKVPLNRILIETDSPYLAPTPKRGKPNEPGYVLYTAEYLANLHHVSLEQFATQTTDNFFTLFKGAVKNV